MYAIVEISGKQYKVENDATINVERLNLSGDDKLTIDTVLLYSDGEKVMVGQPYLSNVRVEASLLGEVKRKKVRGIKFKKRKNYTRTLGHRHVLSRIRINNVVVS